MTAENPIRKIGVEFVIGWAYAFRDGTNNSAEIRGKMIVLRVVEERKQFW